MRRPRSPSSGRHRLSKRSCPSGTPSPKDAGEHPPWTVHKSPPAHERPDRRSILVRTETPGLLLVHLHAAGVRVTVVGAAAQGQLRVQTADTNRLRAIATEVNTHVLEVFPPPGKTQTK